jgi:predicted XRE-type DNA-binding protein
MRRVVSPTSRLVLDESRQSPRVTPIEGTPEKAENSRLRSSLMITLKKHLAGTGLNRAQIAELFGVTQPRVSDLIRGKIDVFGLDALVNMAATAGPCVKLNVRKAV